ncbi:MAG: tetratricopeptide repeat protein [Candidatus Obscuribacterales bacterium]|nr:tetratricopeptide repeat protein [Candidatus Obscuribacterales bacterium]
MKFDNTFKQLEATDELLTRAKELAGKGQLEQAEDLCRRALTSLVQFWGAGSLKSCYCLIDLADINYQQRKYADVLCSLMQVLAVDEAETFLTEKEYLAISFKVAKSLEKTGCFDDAACRYRKLLNESIAIYGDSSSFCMRVVESLKSLLRRHPEVGVESDRMLVEYSAVSDENKPICLNSQRRLKNVFHDTKDDEQLSTTCRAKWRRLMGRNLSLLAALLLCGWFLVSGVLLEHSADQRKVNDARAAIAPTTPGALANYVGLYSSADGAETLVVEKEKGIYSKSSFKSEGGIKTVGTNLYLSIDKKSHISFRTSGQSLVSEGGIRLYRAGSPELDTVTQISDITKELNTFYHQRGRYPHTPNEFHCLVNSIKFSNSMNTRPSGVLFQCSAATNKKVIMTVDDYNSYGQEQVTFVTSGNHRADAGSVELMVNPLGNAGETAIVRGYDRNGELIPSSTVGRCYSVALVRGEVTR